MTRTKVLGTMLAFCLIALVPGTVTLEASGQAPVSILDVVQKSREMDGKQVRLVGEAVGDIMIRGDYAWVNVLDASGTAIGVYVPKDEALKVRIAGSYFWKGDTVDLVGTFKQACPVHDGDPDVHADSLTVVQQGHRVYHAVEAGRVGIGGVLLALAGVLGLTVRRRSSQTAS